MAWTALTLALASIALTACPSRTKPPPPPPPPQPPPKEVSDDLLARGLELYGKHCLACHGEKGRGDGTAGYLLYPKPRDFSNGTLLLTSTEMGMPSDEDLLRTLRNGMPGSAMPPWGHLPEDDLKALVETIRHLALEGQVAQLAADGSLSREEALEIAHEIVDPGADVELPAKPAEVDLALGKKVYLETCAKCHDEDGRGRLKLDMVDEYGNPSFARDFTQGIFKGGAGDEALAMRLVRGLPGSPMPGKDYAPEEVWSVVRYVQEMIKPGAQARVEQRQQTLTAKRVQGSLPADPASADWEGVDETFLAVMPLWWRPDRIEGVTVQAVHDGSKLAVRLRWEDATQDDHMLQSTAFSDGVAVQLSPDEDPPLFAMGAKDAEVKVWYWRASDQRTIDEGRLALADIYPNMPHTDEDAYPGTPKDEIFMTALGAGNPVSAAEPTTSVENLHARGFATLANQGHDAQDVRGKASRTAESWQVVFVRDLDPGRQGELQFEPGQTVHIAFAVWNGSAGDRNGQKSVTIWHRLELEP